MGCDSGRVEGVEGVLGVYTEEVEHTGQVRDGSALKDTTGTRVHTGGSSRTPRSGKVENGQNIIQ